MTYARARLRLGITGVGSIVVIAATALISGSPQTFLGSSTSFGPNEFLQLSVITGLFMLWIMPLDFLGGFVLPTKFNKLNETFGARFRRYVVAAFSKALLFLLFGSLIIVLSQFFGKIGGVAAITLSIIACFVVRNRSLLNRKAYSSCDEKLLDALGLIESWQVSVPKTVAVQHKDIGFTGGVVGVGKYAQIVIPNAWLSFSREQLATAIARRAVAVNSGSYSRGLLLAFAWNVCGFAFCSLLPAAGVTTVAGLVTTICAFTLWTMSPTD